MAEVTLQSQLDALHASSKANLPAHISSILEENKVSLAPILLQAPKVGSTIPDFTLPNVTGTPVTLSTILSRGPVVLSFYRGGWCPYCNLELRALQKRLPEITNLGATLVAITPESVDHSLDTIQKNELTFEVLTDEGNQVATKLGVFYVVDDATKEVFSFFKNDLEKWNGEETGWGLPLPGTFVVDQTRVVRYAFTNPDITKRAEPEEVVKALKELADN